MKGRQTISMVMACSIVVIAATACAANLGERRYSAMDEIGKAAKMLYRMSQAGTFDQATVREQATAIASRLGSFGDLFPDGSENADGSTRPEIWTDRAGFEAARGTAREAAMEVAAVSDAAGFKPAFDALAEACSACHRKFRAEY